MPPPLDALWIADCASASQLEAVLEEIDCVDPIAVCKPEFAAVPWLVALEEDDAADDEPSAEADEVSKKVLGYGKYETDEMAMTAQPLLRKAVAPIRIVGCGG